MGNTVLFNFLLGDIVLFCNSEHLVFYQIYCSCRNISNTNFSDKVAYANIADMEQSDRAYIVLLFNQVFYELNHKNNV